MSFLSKETRAKVFRDLPVVFRELIDTYRFVLDFEDEHTLSLRSPLCIIEIAFEHQESAYFVEFVNPQDTQDRYWYPYVMAIRRPDYWTSFKPDDKTLNVEQKLLLDLGAFSDSLIRYCSDLLAGSFIAIRKEGYHALASYIKARSPWVLAMPADDPIKVKFWREDYSWVRDLQERERQAGRLPSQ